MKVIIDSKELQRILAYCPGGYQIGNDIIPIKLDAKPLTPCRDCKKWKTDNCKHEVIYEEEIRRGLDGSVILTHTKRRYPDPDDYCKDGEAK